MKLKGIIFLFTYLFCFPIFSQSIDWLSISEFEKSISKNKDKDYFILIDDDKGDQNDERNKKIKERLYGFLNDEQTVNYINNNFLCFRFDANESKSIIFNGNDYINDDSKNVRSSHDFASFLTGQDRNRFPLMVLRNNEFELFEYRESTVDINELKVIIEAEKHKTSFLQKNLGEENDNTKRSKVMTQRYEQELKNATETPFNYSIFQLNINPKLFLKRLQFFIESDYKNIDLKTFLSNQKKKDSQ